VLNLLINLGERMNDRAELLPGTLPNQRDRRQRAEVSGAAISREFENA